MLGSSKQMNKDIKDEVVVGLVMLFFQHFIEITT